MKPRTLNDIFLAIVERGNERAILMRGETEWTPISAREFYRNVTGVARALSRWGVVKGDRLAILSENRHEWAVMDFASLLLGLVVVPIYATLTAQQTAYILCDSGARVVAVSTESQLDKILSIQDQTGAPESVGHGPGRHSSCGAIAGLDAARPHWTRCRIGVARAGHHCQRPGIHYLHLWHYWHFQGRAVDSRQSDLKSTEFTGRLRDSSRTGLVFLSATVARDGASCGYRAALPRCARRWRIARSSTRCRRFY